MTLRNYIIIAALGSVLAVRAQEEPAAPVFRPPFDFPLILSGNFGELRSNHFHGGVDFKTQGEVGKPIHCIADGYVSRVLVTPGGYGQAIFITHPNGYTSVYGHVLKFASAVAKVVEEYQYRHETFAVDLKFEPHQVSFKAGEIIALSGNEGYSFGPHLHMEIRRTDTGELIDPLQFYTDKIKDTTPPRASMIMLYPQRGAGVVEGSQRKKSISVASLGQPVSAWGKIAAGIKAYDYMDGTHNNYGVRSVVLYVDTTEVFRSTVDGVLPEENRMINAWTDYEENVKRHNWVMRSQILPGNSLRMLQANDEGGVVTIDEERDYHFRYELADLYGNKSTYRFIVRGYDKEAGIPENSLPAFSRAIARGFGAELDVHLLRDGTLAVFHDSDVKRMTGREGYLEDLSADELKDYALDGTKETIPQFKDVLALFAGTGLPLIVEVKSFRDNFAELTERTMAELDKFDVKYCVESFDPRCVAWLKKHRPEVIRGQLSCDFLKDRGNLSLPMAFATTNLLGNIMAQPDFVAYKFEDKKNWAPRLCRKLYGAQGVYWTIRSKEDLETAEREGAIAIFERFIP